MCVYVCVCVCVCQWACDTCIVCPRLSGAVVCMWSAVPDKTDLRGLLPAAPWAGAVRTRSSDVGACACMASMRRALQSVLCARNAHAPARPTAAAAAPPGAAPAAGRRWPCAIFFSHAVTHARVCSDS
jgi:hypothetical protein